MTATEHAAKLVREASRLSGVEPAEIIGHARTRGFPAARWACWLAMSRHGYSLTQIGQIFLGRDHSTIHKGISKARLMRTTSPEYDRICKTLTNQNTDTK